MNSFREKVTSAITFRTVMGRSVEAVTLLISGVSGFLHKITPPEETSAAFAVGTASTAASIVYILVLVAAHGRLTAKHKKIWFAISIVSFGSFLWMAYKYNNDRERLTFLWPISESEQVLMVAGEVMTAEAQRDKQNDPSLTAVKLVSEYGGIDERTRVWPQDSLRKASLKLKVDYVLMFLFVATAIFCATEGILLRDPAPKHAEREEISPPPPPEPGPEDKYLFDIAFSFAGEDREIAEDLAHGLTDQGYKVFYDEFHQHELWGKDLAEYLGDIYEKHARYCLLITSKAYLKKDWTSHERRYAQARQLREPEGYILQLRLDDTELPGLPSTIAYINYSTTEKIIELLAKKLAAPIPPSDKDIVGLLVLAIELAQRRSLPGLSLILREKLKPYVKQPVFRKIVASYAARLCVACGGTSGQIHEEIATFLTAHETTTFPALVTAYPLGAPCSLNLLSKSPMPAAIELFMRIAKDEKEHTEAWRLSVSTLAKYQGPTDTGSSD